MKMTLGEKHYTNLYAVVLNCKINVKIKKEMGNKIIVFVFINIRKVKIQVKKLSIVQKV